MDFTIVTPTLNQGRYIEQTLNSVISQQNVSVQYIVVDGGSSDETASILERYKSRVSTIISEPDCGQADALRKGFALAEGEIVAYLNSDDYFLPGTLERIRQLMNEHTDTDLIYGDRIFVDADNNLIRYWKLPVHVDYVMLRWDFIPQEAAFWRRSAMEFVGGIDKKYQFAMDYDLFARMMKAGKNFKHSDQFFAVFREHAEAKTSVLMNELGMPEMELVRRENSIKILPWDHLIGAFYLACLKSRSWMYRILGPEPSDFTNRLRC
ncbi:MAG: glycosyltransferase family 2 protein [Verrucomicrobiota bacterium]